MNRLRDESSQAAFEERARALLERGADALDGHTRSRLTQARHVALVELERGRYWRLRWAPVTAIALSVALVLVVGAQLDRRPAADSAALLLEDFDLVAETDNLELLEDIEFYAWLAGETDEAQGGDQSG